MPNKRTPPFVWTKERCARLAELCRTSGLSFKEMAVVLSREWGAPVTFHMLSGKCERSGITKKRPPSIWTEDMDAALQELWEEGLSFEHIAFRLSWKWRVKITKNTAVGRSHRLGLVRKESLKGFEPVPIDFLPGPGECSYPHGHPDKPGFHYCKAPAMPGRPYCTAHAAIAYLRPKKRDEERIAA